MSEADMVLYGFAALVILVVGFFIGFLQSKVKMAKMMRRVSQKKNIGLLRIKTRGGRIISAIQDLNATIYECGDMTFNPMKNQPARVYYEDEIPVIYYDATESRPLKLEDGTITSRLTSIDPIDLEKAQPPRVVINTGEGAFEINTDPIGMKATFMAYDQAKEAEFKLRQKQKQWETMAILLSAIGVVVIGYLIYQQGGKFEELIKSNQALTSSMAQLLNATHIFK